jgi:hypothetical protein
MPSAARQTGSPSTSRLWAAGQGRLYRCAITHRPRLCRALKRYIKSEGLHRVLSEPGERICNTSGRPTESKLKVTLSGIADSSWVATDNHAGYACILSLPSVVEYTPSVVKESKDSEKRPCQCDAVKAQASSYFPSTGVSTKWLQCLLRLLAVDKAGEAFEAGQQGDALRTAGRRQLCTHEARLSICPSLSRTGGRQGPKSMVVLQRVSGKKEAMSYRSAKELFEDLGI